ncbi:MAG: PCYCGC motif-containing (lipo)protein [Nanoarchaeota archaeon]|nr:PCYCGC motif-containing (lipo)protein [Nanoarchaeota archaeon]
MKEYHYNYLWIGIFIISIIGTFFLIKLAYANPLDLPNYAFTKPDIKEAYSFAKLDSNKLTGLPCNCGCGSDAVGHGGRLHSRGLIDCFMQGEINNGGQWDSHASECGLCYEDALIAKNLYAQGKTKEDVKGALEAKYATQIISNDTVYGVN